MVGGQSYELIRPPPNYIYLGNLPGVRSRASLHLPQVAALAVGCWLLQWVREEKGGMRQLSRLITHSKKRKREEKKEINCLKEKRGPILSIQSCFENCPTRQSLATCQRWPRTRRAADTLRSKRADFLTLFIILKINSGGSTRVRLAHEEEVEGRISVRVG